MTTPDRKSLGQWLRRPRIIAALGLVFLVVTPIVAASPAGALSLPDPLGCSASAPDPQRPDGRLSGWLTTTPDPLPAAADPFAPNSQTSIYDQYGTAGNYWPTYDLGCGPHADAIWTDLSNLGLEGASTVLNLTAQLRHFAWSVTWIRDIDNAVKSVNADIKGYFEVMMGLAFMVVGGYAMWRSSKAEYGETATTSGWAILLLAVGAGLLNYPAMAGHAYDTVTVTGAHTVSDALSGQSNNTIVPSAQVDRAVSHVNDDALYRMWLRGMFGDDKSLTAQKYGPLLYPTMAYTWRETRVLDTDRGAGQKITEAKKERFKKVAAQLKSEDPGAYTNMQGKTAVFVRFPLALMAFGIAIVLCLFMAAAALLLFVARIAGRAFIMGAPVIAPFAVIHRWSSPMHRLFGFVTTTVTNLLAFTVAGGIVSLIVTGLLKSTLPLWLAALIVLGVTAIGWSATKPYRSFMHQVGLGGVTSAGSGMLAPVATYIGARRGVREGLEAHEDSEGEAASGFSTLRASDEEYSASPPPPLPAFARRFHASAEDWADGERRSVGAAGGQPALPGRVLAGIDADDGDAPAEHHEATDGDVFVLTDEGVYDLTRGRHLSGESESAPMLPGPSEHESAAFAATPSEPRPRAVQVPYEPLECHLALDEEGREVYAIYSRPNPPSRVSGTEPVVYQDS